MMRVLLVSAALTFALDQASKLGVIHGLDLPQRGEFDVLPPYLVFRWAENYGINFGLFSGASEIGRWVLIGVAVAISALVVFWVRREQGNRIAQLSAGFLVGGALGNVVDRLAYGYVADFLNMSCCGIENPYAFNIADVAIFAGALGLALFSSAETKGKPAGGKPPRRRR